MKKYALSLVLGLSVPFLAFPTAGPTESDPYEPRTFCRGRLLAAAAGDAGGLQLLGTMLAQPESRERQIFAVALTSTILSLPEKVKTDDLVKALRVLTQRALVSSLDLVPHAAALKLAEWGVCDDLSFELGIRAAPILTLPLQLDTEVALTVIQASRKTFTEYGRRPEADSHSLVKEILNSFAEVEVTMDNLIEDAKEHPAYEPGVEDALEAAGPASSEVFYIGILRAWALDLECPPHREAVLGLVRLAQNSQPQAVAALRAYLNAASIDTDDWDLIQEVRELLN